MLRVMVSDLVLHCLSIPHKKDARLEWVNRPNLIRECEVFEC